jgi:TolB-like protein
MNDDANRSNSAPNDFLSLTWQRVKEHRIAQWTAGYVAVAYGIQHAVTLTSEAFDWPHIVTRISMLFLILGAPMAMVFAWYHGERASKRISGGEMAIVSTLLVLISLVFYAFVRPSEPAASAPAQEASVAAARQASLSPSAGISLAVLPFANVSDDKSQEYFSDGITDEISGALSKIPDLRIVGRTSAFQFKGQNPDIQSAGQQLHATHLIEGSVRKAGNRVRITAQLIRSDNGLQVWSENYDRELNDIFAVQEDIAKSIATSLHMTLGLAPGESLVNSRTKDENLHEEYLQARALVRTRSIGNNGQQGYDQLTEAAQKLQQVVAREPDYAPAWALLAYAYGYIPLRGLAGRSAEQVRGIVAEVIPKAEAAAKRAIEIDPKLADGYFGLGFIQHVRAKQLDAMASFEKGMALDSTNPDGLHIYSDTLADLGYVKKSLPLRKQLQTLEPFVPVYQAITARIMFADGDYDILVPPSNAVPAPAIAMATAEVLAAKGRFKEAADTLQATSGLGPTAGPAIALLRNAPAKADLNGIPELRPQLRFVYNYVGAPERYLDAYEDDFKIGYVGPGNNVYLWAPAYAPIRKTSRFKEYIRAIGILDYWRARGWPDLCHATTGDDFECS